MNKLTLTERAIIKLNHTALIMHYADYQKRLDRLVDRLTGDRLVAEAEMRKG